VHLVFDIFQGIGIAAAMGIRPFLPALAVGLLAAAGVAIHFGGTDFAFLQSAPFLIGMFVGACIVGVGESRLRGQAAGRTAFLIVGACALALGALFFAGSLARGHYAAWAGLIGGVVCAAVGVAATRPLLGRVRERLGADAAIAVPLFAEGSAVVTAVLAVVAPPVGPIALALLAWLLVAARRRADQKYAGLRILR
jgi:hypothetical protein